MILGSKPCLKTKDEVLYKTRWDGLKTLARPKGHKDKIKLERRTADFDRHCSD